MSDSQVIDLPRHGGPRPGSGRKPNTQINDEKAKAYLLYSKAKAQREAFAAKTAEIEHSLLIGQVVRVDSIVGRLQNVVRACRDRILGVPSRLASLLAAETDARVIENMLDDELRAIMTMLAKEIADGFLQQ
jgi:hypothetical protein